MIVIGITINSSVNSIKDPKCDDIKNNVLRIPIVISLFIPVSIAIGGATSICLYILGKTINVLFWPIHLMYFSVVNIAVLTYSLECRFNYWTTMLDIELYVIFYIYIIHFPILLSLSVLCTLAVLYYKCINDNRGINNIISIIMGLKDMVDKIYIDSLENNELQVINRGSQSNSEPNTVSSSDSGDLSQRSESVINIPGQTD